MAWSRTKRKIGMDQKARPRMEVEKEYQAAALLVGHKSRMVIEHNMMASQLEKEIEKKLAEMRKLDQEFKSAPPSSQETPEPAPEVTA